MGIKKIAVGVDFSEESQNALELASCIARRGDAELVLMHVGPVALPGTGSVLPSVRVWERIVDQRAAEERLKVKALAQGLVDKGLEASHYSVEGDPADELAKAAEELEVDLIAVGTQGLTGARLFMLGSVAQRVVRRSRCSVLVSRSGSDWESGPKRILVATDFSSHADEALRTAIELAADQASIDIVHFFHVPVPAAPLAGHASGEPSLAALVEDLEKDAKAEGAKLLAEHQSSGVKLSFHTEGSPAASGVISYAKEDAGRYDLVVVGSHGRRGFRRFFLGSVAEKVVRHSPCSTLVVHRSEDRAADE
jgi:nucleotide-binding universal stress UspA family protein